MFDLLVDWFEKSSVVTIFVVMLLSFYLILTTWVFVYKFLFLRKWKELEKNSTNAFLHGEIEISRDSFLYNCQNKKGMNSFYEGCLEAATKEATIGLTVLSIIASTSPFIGLFGTVVGILESFSTFKEGVTLSAVAPALSEALIATAFGILVAIPAYSFHLILKRKAFEIITYLKMQVNFLTTSKSDA